MQRILICLFVVAGLWSCKTNVDTEAVNASAKNATDIQAYIKGKSLTTQKTASGLYYQITKANPTGDVSAVGNTVTFHYVLFTVSGANSAIIDSSSRSKNTPSTTIFGINRNIQGLEEALSILKSGEKATLLMPNDLAFGSQSTAALPAYSAIGIDIEILKTRTEEQQIDDYVAAKNLKVEKLASGLRIIKTATTTETQVATGQTYKVNYTGKRVNDVIFDAGTINVGVGSGNVIKGFDEGISKLRLGEKATIIFPSSLGYGTSGSGSTIPPYAVLVFDIEVVKP